MADTTIKRIGGKIKIRNWIKSLCPFHTIYCETFGGSFAVGFSMPKPNLSKYRLVYNDTDGNVSNFFKVLRDHKEEFLCKVQLTPYSRKDFLDSVDYIESKKDFSKEDPVEWARQYLIYNRQSMFGKEDGTWCISRSGENICMTWANLPATVAEAADFLKHVYIENLDYQDCIKKWDCQECLFYMDPPYEGVEKNFYHPNKKDGFDHKAMADFVKNIQGSCVISYYDSELIRSYYPENEGFQHFTKNVVKNMQTSEKKDSAVELLIVKKSLFAKQKESQLSCFEV